MQSRLLESFLVVAETGRITEAAEVLHVSQPALTKSIHKLEEQLGVTLFDRIASGVSLTRYGEILLHHTKVMENEYRHAIARIEELRDGRRGTLRIGAGPIWLVNVLPPIIARFQAQYPEVRISLIGGVIDTLVPALIAGDLDLICVSLDFPNRSEIVKERLFDVRHVLIADPSHPLAQQDHVDAATIHRYPWVVLKSDYVGTERIHSFFAANGLQPPGIAMETTSIHSLFETLRSGDCIAHIPSRLLVIARRLGLCRLALDDVFWETGAGIAMRSSGSINGPLLDFVTTLKATDLQCEEDEHVPATGD